jgi:hypothetical protein
LDIGFGAVSAQAKYLLVRLISFGCYSHRQWRQASILPNKGGVADAEVARTRGKFAESHFEGGPMEALFA